MTRNLRTPFVAILMRLAGCDASKPAGPVVQVFKTNDYEVEYDGTQKSITVGPGLVRVTRDPEDIRIAEGRLQVGAREYGEVAAHDKVSVVARKVSVNRVERQATPG